MEVLPRYFPFRFQLPSPAFLSFILPSTFWQLSCSLPLLSTLASISRPCFLLLFHQAPRQAAPLTLCHPQDSVVPHHLALPPQTLVMSPPPPLKLLNPCPRSFLAASSPGTPCLAPLPSLSFVPTSSVSQLSAFPSGALHTRWEFQGRGPGSECQQPV